MNKENEIQSFLQKLGVSWFKKNFEEKLTELKTSLLELPSGGEDAEVFWKTNLDIQTLNKFIDEIRTNIDDLHNTSDIDIFVKKYATTQGDIQKIATSITMSTDNAEQNFGKITELILGSHVTSSLEMLWKAISVIETIESKIGPTTLISEISAEDLEYILINSLTEEIEKISNWFHNNKDLTKDNQEDLKTIKTSKSIVEIAEACHTIEHLFMNFISDYLSQHEKNNDYKQMLECNTGVELSELLLIKSTFCEEIFTKFNETKTHQE